MKYRSDIDGLRAVAVLSVVAYHADSSLAPGGLVGVDIFFVISGFLITSLVYEEALSGSFSLLGFYERRARRILPALITMIVVVLGLGCVVMAPSLLAELANSTVATLLFVSNVYFWRSISYFSTDAEYWPLLHTWSLAVEEQFYLLFPLLIILLLRVGSLTQVRLVLTALVVASFAVSVVGTYNWPSATFYLLPTRLWELGVGSALALGVLKTPSSAVTRNLLSCLGAALVFVAIAFYHQDIAFPAWWAALPVFGTALIILSGGQTSVGRVLSLKFAMSIGLISYSLYLWHWPILAIVRQAYGSIELPSLTLLVAVSVTFAVSTISWQFIERPFRNRGLFGRQSIFVLSAVSTLSILSVGILIWSQDGLPSRLTAEQQRVAASMNDFRRNAHCWGRLPTGEPCLLGKSELPPTVLVWGDSHAGALIPAFDLALDAASRSGVVATRGACPPLLKVVPVDTNSRYCSEFNNNIVNWIRSTNNRPEFVIVVARWDLYATGKRARGEPGGAVFLEWADNPARRHEDKLFELGLEQTIKAVTELGIEVIILDDVPEIGWNVPMATVFRGRIGVDTPVVPDINQVRLRSGTAREGITRIAEKYGARFISFTEDLCTPVCATIANGVPIYSDDNHISNDGAKSVLAPLLQKADLFAGLTE